MTEKHFKKCPDCGGELEAGAMIDMGYGVTVVQRYGKAAVPDSKKSMMLGTLEEPFENIRKAVTYRCTQCNRLFSYAQETIQVESAKKKLNQYWMWVGVFVLGFFGFMFFLIGIISLYERYLSN